MKEHLIKLIIELLKKADTNLLDFIYKLLTKSL